MTTNTQPSDIPPNNRRTEGTFHRGLLLRIIALTEQGAYWGNECTPRGPYVSRPPVSAQQTHQVNNVRPNLPRLVVPTHTPTPTRAPVRAAATAATKEPSSPVPSVTVVPPTPMSPVSPIYPPTPTTPPYTLKSYYNLAQRVQPSARIPYLPKYCPHTLRTHVSPRTSGCALCEVQLLACDAWWWSASASSASALCAPQVHAAECTSTMRAIYYALGLPLGELNRKYIDWDIVESIVFMPRACRVVKKSSVRSSSRMRGLFCRARHVFN